ncbi:MAG: HPF/RaiA family ribosome-associated protein, partial [Bacteroidota bacterium]
MKAEISSKSFHASEKLIDFTQHKIGLLTGSCKGITSVVVVLILKKNKIVRPCMCRITLNVGPDQIIAERDAESFESSVLKAVDTVV